MSYLNPLRLHFSGKFEAAVSTVNNDPEHFNNATFKRFYQERQHDKSPNGWWNPRGSGDWRLYGCTVKSAFLRDGSLAAAGDPVLTAHVADSSGTAPAKLVDLDPEQQLVSTIWGLEVRIATTAGATLVRGQFEAAPFTDIWTRSEGAGVPGDMRAAATYQSVLTDLRWADVSASPFLSQLREAADGGVLSIKFNVDAYNMNFDNPKFAMGRIVGTLGPALPGEPRQFVAGRQFMTTDLTPDRLFTPAGQLNFCVGVLDSETRRFYLDLGNALPTGTSGELRDLGDLSLRVQSADGTTPDLLAGVLSARAYTQPAWYQETAGVAVFPPDRPLTGEEFARLDGGRLTLTGAGAGGTTVTGIMESPGGVFVRADQFVFRLSPGDKQEVRIHATRFGHPYPGAGVAIVPTPDFLQPVPGLPVAVPADAVRYDTRVITDERGMAALHIQASDPGTPRGYVDGQLYALYPVLEETIAAPEEPYPFDPANFISLLVWSGFQPDDPPTWHGSIQPILQQYANLYPIMADFLDLGDYDSVGKHVLPLKHAIGLPIADPNSMPVTRDLSAAKRKAILSWLTNLDEDGRPLLGTERHAIPTMRAASGDELAPSDGDLAPLFADGGKSAAASRRPAARAQSAHAVLARLSALQTPELQSSEPQTSERTRS
jgi:hypothetical protein